MQAGAYVPAKVYANLVKLIKYRNMTMTSPAIEVDTIVQKLNHYEFITITGSRTADNIRGPATTLMITLIAPASKYSNKSAEFKKLLRSTAGRDEALELLFVSESALTIHIKKALVQFRAENPRIYVEDHPYYMFMIEAPKHSLVPLHEIASEAEVEEYCRLYYTTKDKFPKILVTDTQAVWIGLRPNMVARITEISETAGIAITYCICSK